MQYIVVIIPLVVALILSRIIYGIFERSGFKGVVTFKMTLEIILLVISMILNAVPFNFQTILLLIRIIIAIFFVVLISTVIEQCAYNKSTSFFSFIINSILIGLYISLILSIISFILLCFINPILLTNNAIRLMFIILIIIISIVIIYSIVKFIVNSKIKSNISKNNEKIINEQEPYVKEEDPMLFCPNCGFKLSENAKFCIGCGKYFYNKRN